MKICLATLIVTLLTSLPMLAQQSSSTGKANSETTAAKTEHIEGKGCVKPGRQNGCFIVNDIKAHRKYNVFFDGKSQPDMYTAISFEGTPQAISGDLWFQRPAALCVASGQTSPNHCEEWARHPGRHC